MKLGITLIQADSIENLCSKLGWSIEQAIEQGLGKKLYPLNCVKKDEAAELIRYLLTVKTPNE